MSATALPLRIEACILAGGLSSRMGRDKSRIRVGNRTMLSHVRAVAKSAGLPVRVLRKDAVARCGPLGGIFTALKTSRANALLFLPCDMPFLTPEILQLLIASLRPTDFAVFTIANKLAGFPCLLQRHLALPIVEQQIAKSELSLQTLAKALRARRLRLPRGWNHQLDNINTPRELQAARKRG